MELPAHLLQSDGSPFCNRCVAPFGLRPIEGCRLRKAVPVPQRVLSGEAE